MARKRPKAKPIGMARRRYERLLDKGQQGCPVGTWAVLEPNFIRGCFRKETDAKEAQRDSARTSRGQVVVYKIPGRVLRGLRGARRRR